MNYIQNHQKKINNNQSQPHFHNAPNQRFALGKTSEVSQAQDLMNP
jgi:hypothetical protein